jgi:hypothetical protein
MGLLTGSLFGLQRPPPKFCCAGAIFCNSSTLFLLNPPLASVMKTPETNNPIKIMQFHRRRGGSAVFWFSKYFLLSLMLAGGGGLATSRAEIRIWTGAVNGYWSEPGNWIPAGPAGPGDLLQFRRDDDAHRSMTNDIVGLTVALQFGLDENDHDYQLDGNAIRLYENHGIEISPDGSSTITINCPLIIFQEDTSFYLWTYGGFILINRQSCI